MTKNEIINMPVDEFIDYIVNAYFAPVPEAINTTQEMQAAAPLLAKYANSYAYLVSLYAYLKSAARKAKRTATELKSQGNENEDAAKEVYEDINDKANITIEFYKAIKQQYAALSRMVTVLSDNLDEMHMSDSISR